MRSVGWVAPILTAVAIFIHGIGDSGSARAESKAPAKKPAAVTTQSSHWNHNGSLVSLVADGKKQRLIYDAPRVGLLDAGVKPGTLLFEGQKKGESFDGIAYQFYRTCKPHGFAVTGSASDDRKQITLKGKAPLLDMNCNVTGSRDDVLIFTASLSAPPEPPKETPVAAASQSKPAAQTPSAPVEAKKPPVAAAPATSAPPEVNRAPAAPASEASNTKAGESSAASTAIAAAVVAPSEAPKDKQVAAAAPVEKVSPPPEEVKQPPTQTASTTTNSLAAASGTAPPTEPVKANQSAPAPGANAGAPKSEVPAPANNTAAPKAEPPKDTQVAALPEAAKTAAKTDDTSVSKNAATAAVVSPPINLPAKTESSKTEAPKIEAPKTEPSKTEPPKTEPPKTVASKTESGKPPVLVESRTVPTSSPEKMMEIVLKNGRILRIGRDIELDVLSKIIAQLERQ